MKRPRNIADVLSKGSPPSLAHGCEPLPDAQQEGNHAFTRFRKARPALGFAPRTRVGLLRLSAGGEKPCVDLLRLSVALVPV